MNDNRELEALRNRILSAHAHSCPHCPQRFGSKADCAEHIRAVHEDKALAAGSAVEMLSSR